MTDRNTSPSDGSRPSNGKLVRVDAVVPEVRGAYGAGSPYTMASTVELALRESGL